MAAAPPMIAQWTRVNTSVPSSRTSATESQATSPTTAPAPIATVAKAEGNRRCQCKAISTAIPGIASSRYRPDRCVGTMNTMNSTAAQIQSNRSITVASRRCCHARIMVPRSGNASSPTFVNHDAAYHQTLTRPQSRATR